MLFERLIYIDFRTVVVVAVVLAGGSSSSNNNALFSTILGLPNFEFRILGLPNFEILGLPDFGSPLEVRKQKVKATKQVRMNSGGLLSS